jgi:hypothetical protein
MAITSAVMESGLKVLRAGTAPGAFGAKGRAVIKVKVPLPARRLLAAVLHQHAVALALLAIEKLHAQRFAALGMGRKLAHRAEEMAVFPQVEIQIVSRRHGLDGLQHTPVTWGGEHQAGGLQTRDVSLQLGR